MEAVIGILVTFLIVGFIVLWSVKYPTPPESYRTDEPSEFQMGHGTMSWREPLKPKEWQ